MVLVTTRQLSFGSYPPANATDDEQDLRDTWFPKARDCTCCKVCHVIVLGVVGHFRRGGFGIVVVGVYVASDV